MQSGLALISGDKLSFDNTIDAEILRSAIHSELLDLVELRTWETNPMAYVGIPGNAIDGLMKRRLRRRRKTA